MPLSRLLRAWLAVPLVLTACATEDAADLAADAGPGNPSDVDGGSREDPSSPQGFGAVELFSETGPVWHFDLELDPSDLAWLDANARDEEYVSGDLVFEGERWDAIGVRYKGGFGSLHSCFDDEGNLTCSKLSIQLSFDHHHSQGRFFGLRRLQFHACNRDRSCLRERLSYGLFRDMGVVTSRAAHATLSINGGPPQLYALVEKIDREFLRDRFEDARGNLFKEVWPSFPNESYYLDGLQTNKSRANVERMLEFAQLLEEVSLQTYDARVGPWLDLDAMARYVAVDLMIHNWDGVWKFYCATPELCGNHNYYIYDEPGAKFVVIPWDLDHTWNRPFEDMGRSFASDGPEACAIEPLEIPGVEIAGIRPPQCDPLLRGLFQGAGLARYRLALDELIHGERTGREALLRRLDRYRAALRPQIPDDPSALSLDDWDAEVAVLRQVIHAQYDAAAALLVQ